MRTVTLFVTPAILVAPLPAAAQRPASMPRIGYLGMQPTRSSALCVRLNAIVRWFTQLVKGIVE